MSGYGHSSRGHSNGNGYASEGRRGAVLPFTENNNGDGQFTKTEMVEKVVAPLIAEYTNKNTSGTKHKSASSASTLENVVAPLVTEYMNGSSGTKHKKGSSASALESVVAPMVADYALKNASAAKIENVIAPLAAEYAYNAAASKLEPLKNLGNGISENRLERPSSSVNDYGYGERRRTSSQGIGYGATEDNWHNSASPYENRPNMGGDYITKAQTEAGRPKRFLPISATSWRQPNNFEEYYQNNNGNGYGSDYGNSNGYGNGNGYSNGYGDYNNLRNNGWQRPYFQRN